MASVTASATASTTMAPGAASEQAKRREEQPRPRVKARMVGMVLCVFMIVFLLSSANLDGDGRQLVLGRNLDEFDAPDVCHMVVVDGLQVAEQAQEPAMVHRVQKDDSE